MPKVGAFIILFIFMFTAYAQNVDTIYYNSDWEKTSDKTEYAFYRVAALDKKDGVYKVQDYFISHKLQMQGQFLDRDHSEYSGHFIWYYENGQKERERDYITGKKHGISEEWYDDGQPKSYITYNMGDKVDHEKYWYQNGQMDHLYKYNTASGKDSCFFWWENGQQEIVGTVLGFLSQGIKFDQYWLESGEQTIINGNGVLSYDKKESVISGPIIDGFKEGKWFKKDSEGNVIGKLIFKEGRFIKGYLTELGYKDKFTSWEREPEYAKGGAAGMSKFISSNLRNSCNDIVYNLVYIKFVVEKDGDLSQISLRKGEVSDCQMASINEMFNKMPIWTPGMQAGYYVRVNFTIPIHYRE